MNTDTAIPPFPVAPFRPVLAAIAALLTTVALAGHAAQGPVSVWRPDWKDATRNRAVPATVYSPAAATAACPVIVFSHGLGGTRDGYAHLGRHWASNGYVSVHVQHVGSDDSVWRGSANPLQSARQATANVAEILARPRDIAFAIDQLEALNRDSRSPLHGRLDLARLGVAGHSFGAYTALAAAGRQLRGPAGLSVDPRDPRIKACIAMSAPAQGTSLEHRSYAGFTVPCLHLTGTADVSPVSDATAAQRRIPYDASPGPHQFLVIFKGGDHMLFSGRRRLGAPPLPNEALVQALILRATLTFWDAWLKEDAKARAWLEGDGLKAVLGDAATLERK